MSFLSRLLPRRATESARSAANPNLEVFKFTVYVCFPLAIMLYFGDPQWYHTYVKPYKDAFSKPELVVNKPPKSQEEARERLAAYQEERRLRREGKQLTNAVQGDTNQQRLV